MKTQRLLVWQRADKMKHSFLLSTKLVSNFSWCIGLKSITQNSVMLLSDYFTTQHLIKGSRNLLRLIELKCISLLPWFVWMIARVGVVFFKLLFYLNMRCGMFFLQVLLIVVRPKAAPPILNWFISMICHISVH